MTSDLVLDVPFYKIGIDADKQRAVGMLDHPEGAQAAMLLVCVIVLGPGPGVLRTPG